MNICLVQMRVESGKRSANLTRALDRMEQAAEFDPVPDLIVLPECVDLGAPKGTHEPSIIEPRNGPFVESLAERARELGVYVAAGVTELEDDRVYSCAILIDPDGDTLARHRRIATRNRDVDMFSSGSTLSVRQTALGRIGLLVGEDLWQPGLAEALFTMQADLILAPSGGWAGTARCGKARKPSLDEMGLRCKDAGSAVASVAAAWAGDSPGKRRAGACSFCLDVKGKMIAFEESGAETVIQVEAGL